MLEKLDFPLTNGQISEFILDKGYTTYFTLQQALSEMVESAKNLFTIAHFIISQRRDLRPYNISRQTSLPPSVKMSMPLSKKNDMNSKMKYLSKQTIIKI
jgi:hypothetical protein